MSGENDSLHEQQRRRERERAHKRLAQQSMKPEGQYRCPECTGGFPRPANDECPWCGQSLDGSYEFESRVISRVIDDDGDEETAGNSLLGWLRA